MGFWKGNVESAIPEQALCQNIQIMLAMKCGQVRQTVVSDVISWICCCFLVGFVLVLWGIFLVCGGFFFVVLWFFFFFFFLC